MDLKDKLYSIEKFINYIKEIDIKDLDIYLNPHLQKLENYNSRLNERKENARKSLSEMKESTGKTFLMSIFEEISKTPTPENAALQEGKLVPSFKVENENRQEFLATSFSILCYIKEIEIDSKFKESFRKLHLLYDKELKKIIDLMNSIKNIEKPALLFKYNYAFNDIINKLNNREKFIENIIEQTEIKIERTNTIDLILNAAKEITLSRTQQQAKRLEELFAPKKEK